MPFSLSNQLKEQVFLAELKRRLFLDGFILAKPEPDVGDDLWALDGRACEQDGGRDGAEEPRLVRCQLKSAVSPTSEGAFTVNFSRAFRFRQGRWFFVLVGIWSEESSQFHIGYFPSRFFYTLKNEGKIRFNSKGRAILDFFVKNSTFGLRLKYPPEGGAKQGRGPRADVTDYFMINGLRSAIERFSAEDDDRKVAIHRVGVDGGAV